VTNTWEPPPFPFSASPADEQAPATENGRECRAIGCDVIIPPRDYMCEPHWRAVPSVMRGFIADIYPAWLCDSGLPECVRATAANPA
jgi:hypothetical protein